MMDFTSYKCFSALFVKTVNAKITMDRQHMKKEAEERHLRPKYAIGGDAREKPIVPLTSEQKVLVEWAVENSLVEGIIKSSHPVGNGHLFHELQSEGYFALCKAAQSFCKKKGAEAYTNNKKAPAPRGNQNKETCPAHGFSAYAGKAIRNAVNNYYTQNNLVEKVSFDSSVGHKDEEKKRTLADVLPAPAAFVDSDLSISVEDEFEKALSNLTAKQVIYVEMFLLNKVYGVPYQLIAKIYEVEDGTARTNVNRGARALRTYGFTRLAKDLNFGKKGTKQTVSDVA